MSNRRPGLTTADKAEVLFASPLQPSDEPTSKQVSNAILNTLRANGGIRGCVSLVAAEFGEHPDTACRRMQWALGLIKAA